MIEVNSHDSWPLYCAIGQSFGWNCWFNFKNETVFKFPYVNELDKCQHGGSDRTLTTSTYICSNVHSRVVVSFSVNAAILTISDTIQWENSWMNSIRLFFIDQVDELEKTWETCTIHSEPQFLKTLGLRPSRPNYPQLLALADDTAANEKPQSFGQFICSILIRFTEPAQRK